jgi:hypothetical protein
MVTALDKITGSEPAGSIYTALLEKLKSVGPFKVEPKASSLHVVHKRAFLGVHYRKTGLLLNIVLDRPLNTPRLKSSEQVSRSRYHNEVLLATPGEVDRELVGWMKEAHRLTGG